MRCVSILVSLSVAGAASVHAGPVDIEFSEQLGVVGEGLFVSEFSERRSVEDTPIQSEPTVVDVEAVSGLEESAADQESVVDVAGTDLADEEPWVIELPADIDLGGPSILETVPIVGSYDLSEAIGEALDIPELPQEYQDAWADCPELCLVPGLEMFEVWEELSDASPELVLTDLDAEPLDEQQPAHASLPATALLMGGALGALAFRRRRQTRSVGG